METRLSTVHFGCLWIILSLVESGAQDTRETDEQRLYTKLLTDYESSVRPVRNASTVINVNFRMSLNQIVDLDERTQVLTTSLFIDQEWTDENLTWNISEFNGIKTLRVPASRVWLPDTFIFNNADDAATGFMRGVYVLINNNGTVRWPVPVKLLSSCKVDIAYFPFDDQCCVLSFGSWIHDLAWMDFHRLHDDYFMNGYMDNSEWKLLQIFFRKTYHTYPYRPDAEHTALSYTLHMRRRTFYYIFNVIVPCIMLSILTLLTFWLPPTSGEKVSLGLSVFLAFSMFMLLIAEEVPATSESVPLIGVYLTTVMTMTSISVIMAVVVINLYNRGHKARRPPALFKKIVLHWICKLLRMTHDIERLAHSIRLDDEDEARYHCPVHHGSTKNSALSPRRQKRTVNGRFTYGNTQPQSNLWHSGETSARNSPVPFHIERYDRRQFDASYCDNGRAGARQRPLTPLSGDDEDDDNDEVWVRRESYKTPKGCHRGASLRRVRRHKGLHTPSSFDHPTTSNSPANGDTPTTDAKSCDNSAQLATSVCRKERALAWRKETILEWQTMALVIDRLLFWVFLFGTAIAYLIILIIIPYVKHLPPVSEDSEPLLPTVS